MRQTLLYAAAVLTAVMVAAAPSPSTARVMMTGSVSGFGMNLLPTANFTLDDWFSNPNLWTISITNSADGKTIKRAELQIVFSSGTYGEILNGKLGVVGAGSRYFISELAPGQSYTINNTMIKNDSPQMFPGSGSYST